MKSRRSKSDFKKKLLIEKCIKAMTEDMLSVKIIVDKGRAVFARRYLKKGDFVCEYAGELISYREGIKREEIYEKDIETGCYLYFFQHKSKSYCVDATKENGRLGRLMNHSKIDGNCHTKLFVINSKPCLIFVASRDIKPDEE